MYRGKCCFKLSVLHSNIPPKDQNFRSNVIKFSLNVNGVLQCSLMLLIYLKKKEVSRGRFFGRSLEKGTSCMETVFIVRLGAAKSFSWDQRSSAKDDEWEQEKHSQPIGPCKSHQSPIRPVAQSPSAVCACPLPLEESISSAMTHRPPWTCSHGPTCRRLCRPKPEVAKDQRWSSKDHLSRVVVVVELHEWQDLSHACLLGRDMSGGASLGHLEQG